MSDLRNNNNVENNGLDEENRREEIGPDEQYTQIKRNARISHWTVVKNDNSANVLLNGEHIDSFMERAEQGCDKFGSIQSCRSVADGQCIEFTGKDATVIALGFYDFSRQNEFTKNMPTSAEEFCSVLNQIMKPPEPCINTNTKDINKNTILINATKKIIGTFLVPLSSLKFASTVNSIRALDPLYVQHLQDFLQSSIENGRDVPFPPASGLIVAPEKPSKKDIEDGKIDIEVFNGNHSLMACKQLYETYPDASCINSRFVTVYNNLADDEVKALALISNEESANARPTSEKDKIQIMRNYFVNKFAKIYNKDYLDFICQIFNAVCTNKREEQKRKKGVGLLARISAMEDECFQVFLELQDNFPDHSCYVYEHMFKLSKQSALYLLKEIKNCKIKFIDLKSEAKKLPDCGDNDQSFVPRIRAKKISKSVDKGSDQEKKGKVSKQFTDGNNSVTKTSTSNEATFSQVQLNQEQGQDEVSNQETLQQERDIAELRRELLLREEKLEKEKEDNADLRKQLKLRDDELITEKQKNKDLFEELEIVKSDLATKIIKTKESDEQTTDNARQAIQDSQEKLTATQTELNTTKSRMEDLNKVLKLRDNELENQRQENTTLESEAISFVCEQTTDRNYNKTLKEQLSEKEQIIKERKEEIANLTRTITRERENAAKLQDELDKRNEKIIEVKYNIVLLIDIKKIQEKLENREDKVELLQSKESTQNGFPFSMPSKDSKETMSNNKGTKEAQSIAIMDWNNKLFITVPFNDEEVKYCKKPFAVINMEQRSVRRCKNLDESFTLDDKDIQLCHSNFKVVSLKAKIINHKIDLEINNLENIVNAALPNYLDN
ncbi:unnamed protein product [Mytilus edulis]|uniref:Uncharacterized protein n=1 Tax=Mytilus edulis TaxID=6550 RepID=A0A8S3RMH7_MYTED|nr:unnamed protein product [Mytilus edulis]